MTKTKSWLPPSFAGMRAILRILVTSNIVNNVLPSGKVPTWNCLNKKFFHLKYELKMKCDRIPIVK